MFDFILTLSTGIAISLNLWQWIEGRLFPLHRRLRKRDEFSPITILKPLKGINEFTTHCLESWLVQNYPSSYQILFLVDSETDPAYTVATNLCKKYPMIDSSVIICPPLNFANRKVSKLITGMALAKYEVLVISDSDVHVPPDLLQNIVPALLSSGAGLISCLYRLGEPINFPMRCEAVAINADFWSSVLQARRLGRVRFALGAVMITHKTAIKKIGGFEAIGNYLADDYWLGRLIADKNYPVFIAPIVVNLMHGKESWKKIWLRQLRWARTIRVSQPIGYLFSILSNLTIWSIIWMAYSPKIKSYLVATLLITLRLLIANYLQYRITQSWTHIRWFYMPLIKDLFQFLLWIGAFIGRKIHWGGKTFILKKDGTIIPASD